MASMARKHRDVPTVLRSVSEIVRFLGGPAKVAARTGHTLAQVQRWMQHGEIPNSWHYRIHLWVQAGGGSVDPVAFGFTADGRTNPKSQARVQSKARIIHLKTRR